MNKAVETAQKIMDHLEGREAPNRGISGAIGRMQRREYAETVKEIANLIEGKPAIEEAKSATESKPDPEPATKKGPPPEPSAKKTTA